jgi:hypothetical protein
VNVILCPSRVYQETSCPILPNPNPPQKNAGLTKSSTVSHARTVDDLVGAASCLSHAQLELSSRRTDETYSACAENYHHRTGRRLSDSTPPRPVPRASGWRAGPWPPGASKPLPHERSWHSRSSQTGFGAGLCPRPYQALNPRRSESHSHPKRRARREFH